MRPWHYSSVRTGGGDPADAFGVGEGVDLHDLAVTDGEPHHGERLTVKGDDDASPSIGQGGV